MKKSVLYITMPDNRYRLTLRGYKDAFEHLGWKFFHCHPTHKLETKDIIEQTGASLIMTYGKYGTRQLPIDFINLKQIPVVIKFLHLEQDDYDPCICNALSRKLLSYDVDQSVVEEYYRDIIQSDVNLTQILPAGNINMLSNICVKKIDVSCFANPIDNSIQHILGQLFGRLKLLNKKIACYKDLPEDIGSLRDVYATSTISLNMHTDEQCSMSGKLNEQLFQIPLSPSIQVTNSPIAKEIFGDHILCGGTIAQLNSQIENLLTSVGMHKHMLYNNAKYVAENHTFFHRLAQIFEYFNFDHQLEKIGKEIDRLSVKYMWDLEARLDCEEPVYGKELSAIA